MKALCESLHHNRTSFCVDSGGGRRVKAPAGRLDTTASTRKNFLKKPGITHAGSGDIFGRKRKAIKTPSVTKVAHKMTDHRGPNVFSKNPTNQPQKTVLMPVSKG